MKIQGAPACFCSFDLPTEEWRKMQAGGMGLGAWGLELKGLRPDCWQVMGTPTKGAPILGNIGLHKSVQRRPLPILQV